MSYKISGENLRREICHTFIANWGCDLQLPGSLTSWQISHFESLLLFLYSNIFVADTSLLKLVEEAVAGWLTSPAEWWDVEGCPLVTSCSSVDVKLCSNICIASRSLLSNFTLHFVQRIIDMVVIQCNNVGRQTVMGALSSLARQAHCITNYISCKESEYNAISWLLNNSYEKWTGFIECRWHTISLSRSIIMNTNMAIIYYLWTHGHIFYGGFLDCYSHFCWLVNVAYSLDDSYNNVLYD